MSHTLKARVFFDRQAGGREGMVLEGREKDVWLLSVAHMSSLIVRLVELKLFFVFILCVCIFLHT